MKTLIITRADLNYRNEYVGKTDVTDFDGAIEIEADLGLVRFRAFLRATKHIKAAAGSGIKAGGGIEAGEGIEAGWGIKAGGGIEAGEGIKAGSGIEAGEGIKAGSGIKAGLRIFAGICIWRIPSDEEKTIRCKRLIGGEIGYGTLIESEEAAPDEVPAP
jgi:hypothetical protein